MLMLSVLLLLPLQEEDHDASCVCHYFGGCVPGYCRHSLMFKAGVSVGVRLIPVVVGVIAEHVEPTRSIDGRRS